MTGAPELMSCQESESIDMLVALPSVRIGVWIKISSAGDDDVCTQMQDKHHGSMHPTGFSVVSMKNLETSFPLKYPLAHLPIHRNRHYSLSSTPPPHLGRPPFPASRCLNYLERLPRTEVLDNRPASLPIGGKSNCGSPNQATCVTHSIDTVSSCNTTRPWRRFRICRKQVISRGYAVRSLAR